MAKTAGAKDVAPRIRGAFLRAAKIAEEQGKSLTDFVLESMEKDFLGTLTAIAKYCPKELDISGEINHSLVQIIQRIDSTREGRPAIQALEGERSGDFCH